MILHDFTKSQQLIYQMSEYGGEGIANISASLFFDDYMTKEALLFSIHKMLESNDIFKIRICCGEEPKQYIEDYVEQDIELLDFESRRIFEEWANTNAKIPFNLGAELYDIKVINIRGELGIFIKIHHIISDAWTLTQMLKQVHKYSDRYIRKESDVETSKTPSFIDYVKKSRAYYESKKYVRDRKYWESIINTDIDCVSLSTKNSCSLTSNRSVKVLDKNTSDLIRNFCNEQELSATIIRWICRYLLIEKMQLPPLKANIVVGRLR